jgi:HAD superfamily hydrolase (TIGR01484 family)
MPGEVNSGEWLAYEQAKQEGTLESARVLHEGGQEDPPEETRRSIELEGVYADSAIGAKIEARVKAGNQPIALFSDIDNTFYKKGEVDLSEKLDRMLTKNNWGLVYDTGRDFPMVDEQKDLPKADVVVGAVGTEIFVKKSDGNYEQDQDYRDLLLGTWDRDEVYVIAQELVDENEGLIFQPRDVPGAAERGDTDQSPQEFKISFNIEGDHERARQITSTIEGRLPGARVILSQDINRPDWWNVDLLPVHAGKELAVRYLSEKLGIGGMVSGDSGNDMSMLTESGCPGILVGNAHDHVKAEVVTLEPMASFGMETRKLPNGCKISYGRKGIDDAATGLMNALRQGDLTGEDAKWFVKSFIELSKEEE